MVEKTPFEESRGAISGEESSASLVARLKQRMAPYRWTGYPIALFVCLRLGLFAFSALSMRLVAKLYNFESRRQVFLKDFPTLDGLCRWDCGWYTRIASHGYQHPADMVFWPLYPMLGRGLSAVTGMPEQFALIFWSMVASLGSLIVLYRLFWELSNERSARLALAAFATFPFGFYQGVAYPESFMTFFGALSLLWAVRGRHVRAGLGVGLGALSRHVCGLAGLGLLVAQVQERTWRPKRFFSSWAVVGLVLPFVTVAAYAFFAQARFGDPFAFLNARAAGWGPSAWYGIVDLWELDKVGPKIVSYIILGLIPTVGAAALLKERRWWPLAAYAIPLMAVFWVTGMPCMGRYAASCWPAFLPMGVFLAKRSDWALPLLFGSALFQGLFAFLYMHQFPVT